MLQWIYQVEKVLELPILRILMLICCYAMWKTVAEPWLKSRTAENEPIRGRRKWLPFSLAAALFAIFACAQLWVLSVSRTNPSTPYTYLFGKIDRLELTVAGGVEVQMSNSNLVPSNGGEALKSSLSSGWDNWAIGTSLPPTAIQALIEAKSRGLDVELVLRKRVGDKLLIDAVILQKQ